MSTMLAFRGYLGTLGGEPEREGALVELGVDILESTICSTFSNEYINHQNP